MEKYMYMYYVLVQSNITPATSFQLSHWFKPCHVTAQYFTVLQRPYIVCILCCVFQATESHPGSQRDFALRRLQLGESLYYKTLENIVNTEKALRESSVAVRTHSLFSLIKVYHNKVSFLQKKLIWYKKEMWAEHVRMQISHKYILTHGITIIHYLTRQALFNFGIFQVPFANQTWKMELWEGWEKTFFVCI